MRSELVGIKYLTSETTATVYNLYASVRLLCKHLGNSTTATTFTVNTMHTAGPVVAGDNFVAYCFAEVEGFSKFGSGTPATGAQMGRLSGVDSNLLTSW
jgi:hypothetical protein